jgi:hypothetical protein
MLCPCAVALLLQLERQVRELGKKKGELDQKKDSWLPELKVGGRSRSPATLPCSVI